MGQLPQLFSILVHFSLVLLLFPLQTVDSAISLRTSVWAGLHFPSGCAVELTAYFSIQTSVKSHYHLSAKIQKNTEFRGTEPGECLIHAKTPSNKR